MGNAPSPTLLRNPAAKLASPGVSKPTTTHTHTKGTQPSTISRPTSSTTEDGSEVSLFRLLGHTVRHSDISIL